MEISPPPSRMADSPSPLGWYPKMRTFRISPAGICSTAKAITLLAATLMAMDQITPTFSNGSASMITAGRNPHGERLNSFSNVVSSWLSTWLIGCMNDRTQYAAVVSASGSNPVFIISLTLTRISVFVMPATMLAEDDTGDARSPK